MNSFKQSRVSGASKRILRIKIIACKRDADHNPYLVPREPHEAHVDIENSYKGEYRMSVYAGIPG